LKTKKFFFFDDVADMWKSLKIIKYPPNEGGFIRSQNCSHLLQIMEHPSPRLLSKRDILLDYFPLGGKVTDGKTIDNFRREGRIAKDAKEKLISSRLNRNWWNG